MATLTSNDTNKFSNQIDHGKENEFDSSFLSPLIRKSLLDLHRKSIENLALSDSVQQKISELDENNHAVNDSTKTADSKRKSFFHESRKYRCQSRDLRYEVSRKNYKSQFKESPL